MAGGTYQTGPNEWTFVDEEHWWISYRAQWRWVPSNIPSWIFSRTNWFQMRSFAGDCCCHYKPRTLTLLILTLIWFVDKCGFKPEQHGDLARDRAALTQQLRMWFMLRLTLLSWMWYSVDHVALLPSGFAVFPTFSTMHYIKWLLLQSKLFI